MAEHISTIQEIKQLSPKVHLLCPRQSKDDQDRYEDAECDENIQTEPDDRRLAIVKQSKARRQKFISSLQLLAYDGKESEHYQRYIWDALDAALGRCELCIKHYYMGKISFQTDLREEYDEEEVKNFFDIIDRHDINRIQTGLAQVTKTLQALPAQRRKLGALQPAHLHAIFEALTCDAFLQDETLLQQYFDEPFRLIQNNKKLKITEFLPAVTCFFFGGNEYRTTWANFTWDHIGRPPTDVEWDWTMRAILQKRLQDAASPGSIQKLWYAMTVIVNRLDEKQITHQLFALVPHICTTALNHLARQHSALPHIVLTMKLVLEKAPEGFWQAMGSISSSTVVEQIFASPTFDKSLDEAAKDEARDLEHIDIMSWILPLLRSLKPANRPFACHTLVRQLFEHVYSESISRTARVTCFQMSLKVLLYTIMSFSDNESTRKSVERVVLSDTLNTISHRIDDLFQPTGLQLVGTRQDSVKADVLGVVRNAIALECYCLKADFEALSKDDGANRESSSYSPDIWHAVTRNLHENDIELSKAVVLGVMPLPGLEQFRARDPTQLSRKKQDYNSIFDKITGMETRILERLSEFSPTHLDELFKTQDTCMSMMAALFSADTSTYQSGVDLVKTISGDSGRKEALSHLFSAFLDTTVYSICWVFRRISNMKTFSSVPRLLTTGLEILDILCNKEDGILRTRRLSGREFGAIQSYWSYQWIALKTVFRQTEQWSQEVHDKPRMTEVCRDAMQYAEELFEQYDTFASALTNAKPDRADEIPKTLLDSGDSSNGSPLKTLDAMSRWLRLRDDYLANTLVKLIAKMLDRLRSRDALIANDGLAYVQDVATKSTIKTILSDSQKAVLIRALEGYYGKRIDREASKFRKQSTLKSWADVNGIDRSGTATPTSPALSNDDFDDSGIDDKDFFELLSGKHLDIHKAALAARTRDEKTALPSRPESMRPKQLISKGQDTAAMKTLEAKAFIENRKKEMAAAKLKQQENLLKLRGKHGIGEHTSGQGSGLSSIGVRGKDHSSGPNSMMVSSDSESDSDDEDDLKLFGGKVSVVKSNRSAVQLAKIAPTKKVKVQRTQKDIRARLAPDLAGLHKTILGWDFFANTDFPPNSTRSDYALVTNVFKTVADYQATFEPLLILEGWQGFRSAREDGISEPLEITITSSLIVDNFVEVNATVLPSKNNPRPGVGVADVILLSKSTSPGTDPEQPHCLARVKEFGFKKHQFQIVLRVNSSSNPLRTHLTDKSKIWGAKVLSLTTLEREYGALVALQYYDLGHEIIGAKPSPLLEYSENDLQHIVRTYDVNPAQAKAVKSALDNDCFTLIQGPPGSGKTKTICAIVGAMMTGHLKKQPAARSNLPVSSRLPPPPTTKKILVCAPSNAAVDELVMRLKARIKMMDDSTENLSVVRLGRSEAINVNVKDVTLEELVSARLNAGGPKEKNDLKPFMDEHKSTCDEINALHDRFNLSRSTGTPVKPEDENLMDALRRKRKNLGSTIDEMREKNNNSSRDAELNRRRVQQQILDSAHVLCATLSGSGHELFQGLNVEFETVIIDEAAQSIELSALIPLKYGTSKCILVGDPKQLPPTVLSREAARFQYEQSLFARMEKNHPKDIHLLDTQYRMHPEISLFPSKTFYDGRLKDGDGMAKLRERPWHHSDVLGPYRFFDVQGMSSAAPKGHSLVNLAEINVALQLYERLITDVKLYDFRGKIGIITPYKGQLKELRSRFEGRYSSDIHSAIEFNTTDAFQGRESEIIIFSCVRASTKGIGFLQDIRRMNVGLTRAKCSLWVLGNSESLTQGEFWNALITDAKSRKLYTDGDVVTMLRRPLLTEDMMKDDVEMMDVGSPLAPSSRSVIVCESSAAEISRATTEDATSAKLISSIGASLQPRPSSSISESSSSDSWEEIKRPALKTDLSSIKSRGTSEQKVEQKVEVKHRTVPPTSDPKRDMKIKTHSTGSTFSTKMGTDGPSGGRFGLNGNAVCNICGSDKHFSHNCDNAEAVTASLGVCYRCNIAGHTKNTCAAPRCLECGEVGHTTQLCQAASHRKLGAEAMEEVRRQEIAWGKSKERAREKRAEKQLGEHDAKIPAVKSTLPSKTGVLGSSSDGKRKRENSENINALKGSKAMRVSDSNGSSRRDDESASDPREAPGVGPARGAGKLAAPLIKKKKQRDDDMFMKRK